MSSAKALLGNVFGRFLFRDATVARIDHLTPRFRRLLLRGSALRSVRWTPGDKVQVFLPEVGMRTYTPARWDAQSGETELLVYVHGDAPGSRWASALQLQDRVQLFGPRASLAVGNDSHAIVVGDETSLGLAVANGLRERALLEVNDEAEVRTVAQELKLTQLDLVQRTPDDGHLMALGEAVERALRASPASPLVLSGRAAAIQAVRRGLKARAVAALKTNAKAYWSPGKVGLD